MSTIATLDHQPDRAPSTIIRDLGTSYALSQAVYVAATLGIADLLAVGPKSSTELAAETGAHAPSLYRVLRLLTGEGVFKEREDGSFELTPAAACLRTDVPNSMRLLMLWGAEEYRAFGDLLYSVKTGAPAWDHVFGMGAFPYLAQHAESGRIFNEALTDWVFQQHAAVVKAYTFRVFDRLSTWVAGKVRSSPRSPKRTRHCAVCSSTSHPLWRVAERTSTRPD